MDYKPKRCNEVYNLGRGEPVSFDNIYSLLQKELGRSTTKVIISLHIIFRLKPHLIFTFNLKTDNTCTCTMDIYSSCTCTCVYAYQQYIL